LTNTDTVKCRGSVCHSMCQSVMQCMSLRVLQYALQSVLQCVLQYAAVCCSVLQCAAVCCSVLQCIVFAASGRDPSLLLAATHTATQTLRLQMCVYSCSIEWRRRIACLELQDSLRKRAITYRALLRKLTYYKGSCSGVAHANVHAFMQYIRVCSTEWRRCRGCLIRCRSFPAKEPLIIADFADANVHAFMQYMNSCSTGW